VLIHLVALLVQAFAKLPPLVGSNWGGLLFTLASFLCTGALLIWKDGVKQHVGRNALISLGVTTFLWTCLFCYSVVRTVYEDHEDLVGASARIRRSKQEEINTLSTKLLTSKQQRNVSTQKRH
jgi:hypothetical protein